MNNNQFTAIIIALMLILVSINLGSLYIVSRLDVLIDCQCDIIDIIDYDDLEEY